MSMINNYLLRDDDEGFYNVILFNEEIKVEDLEKFIKEYKTKHLEEWNIENITQGINENFNVKKILFFDYLVGNTGDIVNDNMFEIDYEQCDRNQSTEKKNLVKYESITVLRNNLSEDEKKAEINRLIEYFEKNNMEITGFQDLDKRKLAYPVGENKEGYYLEFDFIADRKEILPFETFLRESENILKYITLKDEPLESSKEEEDVL